MAEPWLRRFARDSWVRRHGTPRITVLAGEHARRAYLGWMEMARTSPRILEGADRMPEAYAYAIAQPHEPIAVVASASALAAWRADRDDRLAAMFDEGLVEIPVSSRALDARSAAEAALFEALEATPATAGLFALNEALSVRFGANACEVDLLCRSEWIAVEVDGYHHFTDANGYRRDRRKDVLMQLQGLIVIRVLAEDVVADPREAIQMVCEALAFRRSRT